MLAVVLAEAIRRLQTTVACWAVEQATLPVGDKLADSLSTRGPLLCLVVVRGWNAARPALLPSGTIGGIAGTCENQAAPAPEVVVRRHTRVAPGQLRF